MNVRRFAIVLLLSAVGTVATATPALAHAELIASTPAAGTALAAPPQQIQLTFSEAVTLPPDPVAITGSGGVSWTIGSPSIAGAVVTVPVQPAGPAGPYTLAYRVISGDGDEVTGTVAFTLTAAVPTPTTTQPTTTSAAPPTTTSTVDNKAATEEPDQGLPVWAWIIISIAVLAAGAVVAQRLAGGKDI